MDPTNKHFYATVVAPDLIKYRTSQLTSASSEGNLLDLLDEIELHARTAKTLLMEAMQEGVTANESLSEYRAKVNGRSETSGSSPAAKTSSPKSKSKSSSKKKKKSSQPPSVQRRTDKSGDPNLTPKGLKRRKYPPRTPAPKGFPRNLRKARMDRDYNQTQLAATLDIHPVTISKLESGERDASPEMVETFANFFEMDPADLHPEYLEKKGEANTEEEPKAPADHKEHKQRDDDDPDWQPTP